MSEVLTAAQMRAVEQAAIATGEVTGLELMERAGRGVVEAIFEEWPAFSPPSAPTVRGASPPDPPEYCDQKEGFTAVILCGPGNNGGDGFVVARLLHELGWRVEVYVFGEVEKLPPDARVNYERWSALGEVRPLAAYEQRKTWGCDLLLDALFGTGLTRALRGFAELFWNMEDMVECFEIEPGRETGRPAIVAVDMPSGVCSDSGRVFPHDLEHWRFAASAHLTVTFHRAKLGHYLSDGPDHCGRLVVKDIGLAHGPLKEKGGPQQIACLNGATHPNWLEKTSEMHKFSHGHALVLSGGAGRTGAARLAARGALRVGAGLVTLGVPPAAQQEVACQITALMLRRVADGAALTEVLEDGRINALCLGPGLGLGDRAAGLVAAALGASGRALVLDADALTLIARDPALFEQLHARCVLTPHGGEFARLFPDIAARLEAPATAGPAYSKADATREAAARAGCVVLYKGADTVIAAPDGRCVISSAGYVRAAPWLATAGSGDVLAGFIAGFLARGFDPLMAAGTGAWLHVECARAFGPGLIAEDLPEQVPQVYRALGV